MHLVAIDFETTGCAQGWPDEPWQLGLAVIEDGEVRKDACWETFFKIAPDRPFSPRAPGRWAQMRAELAAAPAWNEQWESVAERR